MTEKFAGFPKRSGRSIPLPGLFFSDLLPLVDDLAELKVTLFCFWALYQKEGNYRYLRRRDFVNDAALMRGLAAAAPGVEPEAALDAALRKACERGTILCVEVELSGGADLLYFVNTARGRAAVEQIEAGAWKPAGGDNPVEVLPQRPNVYRLYEDNIGPLTPMIADALKDAEREYPAAWLEDAIRVAVEGNARNWRYVLAVLERWRMEGRGLEVAEKSGQPDGRRYVSGKYADFIEH